MQQLISEDAEDERLQRPAERWPDVTLSAAETCYDLDDADSIHIFR